MRLIKFIVAASVLFQFVRCQPDWNIDGAALYVRTRPPADDGLGLSIELVPLIAAPGTPNEPRRSTPEPWLDPLEPPEPEHARRPRTSRQVRF